MAQSEEARQKDKKILTLYMGLVITILLIYCFSYSCSFIEDGSNFVEGVSKMINEIQNFNFLFSFNMHTLTGAFIGAFIGGLITFILWYDNEKHASYKDDAVAGTGGYMSEKEMKEYAEKYIYPDPKPIEDNLPVKYNPATDEKLYSQNMIMSNNFSRPVLASRLIGNNSIVVVGGAGTGKSRFLIKPNILQMNASFIVTDPSGEMIQSVGTVLKNHGYKIKIFNISDMAHSNCYNPLKYIRDEAGVNMVIECLINNTTNGKNNEDFWVKAEKLLYSACIFYLIDFCKDDSKKNFAGVMNMVNSSKVDENNPNAKSPLDLLFEKCPKNSLAWKYYKAFKQAAGKTLKSIIITCVTRLQPFMTPQVVNLTKTDNLEIENIGNEKTALFVITPQADRTYAFLASMLYSQIFETLYYIGEQKNAKTGNPALPIPVRCMMDEFANIGEVPEFPSKLATMRKYNISAMVVLQYIAQIEAMYKDDWKTLVGNCSTSIFLGSSEPNTLKYFSERLGKKTIKSKSRGSSKGKNSGSENISLTAREVETAEELGRMPPDECVVYTMNMRPVRDKKYKYENHPYYKQTADYDSKYNFNYKEMSLYDNANSDFIDSMVKARSETARYKNMIKTKNPSNEYVSGDVDQKANDITLADDKTVKQTLEQYFQIAQNEVVLNYNDKVNVIKMDDMNPQYIPQLLNKISATMKKNMIIIFRKVKTENKEVYFGIGIDAKNEGLKEAMENAYSIKVSELGKYPVVVVEYDNFEKYKEAVNSKIL